MRGGLKIAALISYFGNSLQIREPAYVRILNLSIFTSLKLPASSLQKKSPQARSLALRISSCHVTQGGLSHDARDAAHSSPAMLRGRLLPPPGEEKSNPGSGIRNRSKSLKTWNGDPF
jgi:hypothetical protein